jgi:hypothetical protein
MIDCSFTMSNSGSSNCLASRFHNLLCNHSLFFHVQTGTKITFSWTFTGIGKTTCTHDGVPVTPCDKSVTVQAKEITSTSQQHTFNVVFEDVCGNTKRADFSYTQQGVVADTRVDPVITTLPDGTVKNTTGTKNAAPQLGPATIGVLAGLLIALALTLI